MDTRNVKLLRTAMGAYQDRLRALSSNIANLDTPGYRRMEVSFEETLQDVRHSVAGPERLTEVQPRTRVGDGPAVLEDELMELADTQMRTQASLRALSHHFGVMRQAITGRTG